jgi:hypothetical protein
MNNNTERDIQVMSVAPGEKVKKQKAINRSFQVIDPLFYEIIEVKEGKEKVKK